jgi:hypothetical protein
MVPQGAASWHVTSLGFGCTESLGSPHLQLIIVQNVTCRVCLATTRTSVMYVVCIWSAYEVQRATALCSPSAEAGYAPFY